MPEKKKTTHFLVSGYQSISLVSLNGLSVSDPSGIGGEKLRNLVIEMVKKAEQIGITK